MASAAEAKVRRKLGIRRTSLGSLSGASRVFDPGLLREVLDVLKGIPVRAEVTHARESETKRLKGRLQPGRLCVIDRGFAEYGFFRDVIDAGSSFVGRVRQNAVHGIVEERRVTDRLELPAELVALLQKYRWQVELFLKWLKCVLGCRHLVAESENGVRIRIYAALIASLLIVLWTGRKPTKRTYELLQFCLAGRVSQEELDRHLALMKRA